MAYLILAINPGSTNTKIGLFRDQHMLFKESCDHPDTDRYPTILAQKDMRSQAVLDMLAQHHCHIEELNAVVGRGGILPPLRTGGYRINQYMLDLLSGDSLAPHASNLGAIIADDIANRAGGIPAFIYDAVSASEFPPIAQVTGWPQIKRTSFCHVLNSRAAAIHYAAEQGCNYADLNLIVAHLGGGITVSVHSQGRIIDSLADDNGPFAPERSGGLPLLDVIDLCYSGQYTQQELRKLVRGQGGLKALTGTSDCRILVRRMEEGDEEARFMLEAQAYQIAKGIGLLAPVLKGRCDAIILTGGLAYNDFIVGQVREYVSFIAPLAVLPGEFELEALAEGTLRILRGEEEIHEMAETGGSIPCSIHLPKYNSARQQPHQPGA